MFVGEVGIDSAYIGVLYSDGEWRIPHVSLVLFVTCVLFCDRCITPLGFNSASMRPR